MKQMLQKNHLFSYIERCLQGIFLICIVSRVYFPFRYNPLDYLFSDPKRHWQNGLHVWDPNFISSLDTKFYQLWVWGVRSITGDDRDLVAAIAGILCAITPWLWYRCFRELLPAIPALLLGIMLALHPSQLVIFAYTMSETVFLPLLALALWLTLRMRHTPSFQLFFIAQLCWWLVMITRTIGVPMGLFGLMLLFYYQQYRLRPTVIAWISGLLICVPAGIHTYQNLHVFAPFRYTAQSEINRLTGSTNYGYSIVGNGSFFWTSPAFYSKPLHPFGEYKTYRHTNQYTFSVDLTKGTEDWNTQITALKKQYREAGRFWEDFKENALFFLLGPSWPDAKLYDSKTMWVWNFHARWTWAILIPLMFFFTPFIRNRREQNLLISLAWLLTLMMFVQQTGVMEGRYRKPIEPLILFSVITMAINMCTRKPAEHEGREFAWQTLYVVFIVPWLKAVRTYLLLPMRKVSVK